METNKIKEVFDAFWSKKGLHVSKGYLHCGLYNDEVEFCGFSPLGIMHSIYIIYFPQYHRAQTANKSAIVVTSQKPKLSEKEGDENATVIDWNLIEYNVGQFSTDKIFIGFDTDEFEQKIKLDEFQLNKKFKISFTGALFLSEVLMQLK